MKIKILGLLVCSFLLAISLPLMGSLDQVILNSTFSSSCFSEKQSSAKIQEVLASEMKERDILAYPVSPDKTIHDPSILSTNADLGSYNPLDDDRDNQPPILGTHTPLNNSNNNPLNFYWNISIEDPDGDLIDWTIHCDNGQTTGQKDEKNGTKTLNLSDLDYSKTYKIWVNATDPVGSGQYTRAWYTFDTKESLPPFFGTPNPGNNTDNQPVSFSWEISINDAEGDLFDWTIQCSNEQSNSGTDATNGTKILSLSGLAYLTPYTVWVNATDPLGSNIVTRRWYSFTTKPNLPPVFGTPSPSNGSTNNPLILTWSIPISDPEGNTFSWTIQCSNGQLNSGTGATNGTQNLALTTLVSSTTYTVWVNATDETGSGAWKRSWYTFATTQQNNSPLFGKHLPANNSINNPLNLSWSILINDSEGDTFSWTIQCTNGQGASGTNAMNGTKILSLTNLTNGITYKIWVNATDPDGSGQYTRRWYIFTTEGNIPPILGTPTPINGSIDRPLSLTWSISINDPEGNQFSWTIQCSNSQSSSGTGAINGTKTLTISSLTYSRTYSVWVNTTDPVGSGLYTRRWYIFTTRASDSGPSQQDPPLEPSNTKPIADASAGEPYKGFVGSMVRFDGSRSSDSDGFIIEWLWGFGDGTDATGRIVNHSYTKAGKYMVILTVTDDKGATHSTMTACTVQQQNRPPSTPTITGPTQGTKNTSYTYTISSKDPDNDSLLFTIDWGDGTNYISGFLTNATDYSLPYRWTAAGRYNLTVTVTDNHSQSSSKLIVYIDAVQTRGAGYLLDTNTDGLYDAFYSDETFQVLPIQRDGDTYLIDKDGDGNWDYVYDELRGLTAYQPPRETPGFEVLIVLGVVAVILFLKRKKRKDL